MCAVVVIVVIVAIAVVVIVAIAVAGSSSSSSSSCSSSSTLATPPGDRQIGTARLPPAKADRGNRVQDTKN